MDCTDDGDWILLTITSAILQFIRHVYIQLIYTVYIQKVNISTKLYWNVWVGCFTEGKKVDSDGEDVFFGKK